MTQMQLLSDIAIYAGQAGFWAAVAFPVITAFFWPWWRHLWGLTVVALDIAIALALLGDVLVIEFGLVPVSMAGLVFSWVDACALCTIPLIIIWRALLTYLTQRNGAKRDRNRGRGAD